MNNHLQDKTKKNPLIKSKILKVLLSGTTGNLSYFVRKYYFLIHLTNLI
jgi:hypothetical protein